MANMLQSPSKFSSNNESGHAPAQIGGPHFQCQILYDINCCYGKLIKYNVYLDFLEIIDLDSMVYMYMCLETKLSES